MTSHQMQAKRKEYKEMKRLAKKAQAATDSIADEIKALQIESEYKLFYAHRKRTTLTRKHCRKRNRTYMPHTLPRPAIRHLQSGR